MFEERWEISGQLRLLSSTHIGSGETTRYEHVRGTDGSSANDGLSPEVATIVRDKDRKPIIPATALKGMIRRTAEQLANGAPDEEKVAKSLFGEIKSDGTGKMGRLMPRTAVAVGLPNAKRMPFATQNALNVDGRPLGQGIYIAAQTAIDAATGTAAANKLFYREMVAADAEFSFRLLLLAWSSEPDSSEALLHLLLRALGCLTDHKGVPIGRGGATAGRLRLVPSSVEVLEVRLTKHGELKSKDVTTTYWTAPAKKTRLPGATRMTLRLECDGPFLVADASATAERERKKARGETAPPQIVGQRDASGSPLIPGDSVMGALRSRARWLLGLEQLARGVNDSELRRIDASAYGKSTNIGRTADVEELSPVERVFGVSGFKGLLELTGITLEEAEKVHAKEFVSVKMDRFSGAPIDQALFQTSAFVGVKVTLTFQLKDRGGVAKPNTEDEKLLDLLFDDLTENGLVLGHGVNKGFGWFRVAKKEFGKYGA